MQKLLGICITITSLTAFVFWTQCSSFALMIKISSVCRVKLFSSVCTLSLIHILRDDAERQLLEVANQKVFEIDISEMTQNVELGDIVGARDRRTGLYYKSDIYKKVFRIDTNGVTITHEVRKEGE